ncbi:MAG TPA: hypothetical protein VJ858_04175 [Acidimicrobiia bacterium]|nr:hypothetical protein [Acidimicrobiia bacterium]
MSQTFERLTQAMPLLDDLIEGIEEDDLRSRLPVPSNTIWDQLWCVVGARESHARAISSGEWGGFTCSLTAVHRGSKAKVVAALETSRDLLVNAGETSPDSPFIFDVLLHETQHQGQLIRYIYGLGLTFPESWKARWSL